ncbi:hypothetical protein K8O93_00890 [Gordonia bronchialis]|uniref:hypothetical protein n=1 Tax=Gordonia bronchialis TaxID=2054 RepID=UPI001CC0BF54|nr:hypothetical protein [Gordonia bronchialis]UAK38389.1 hypothetical protein K8O93_00890 [Gordonia bronchialis]
MSNTLHYPGDQREADWTGRFGPDLWGAEYTVANVEYEPENDRTTVRFKPEVA